jgi:hypothetical protein
MVPEEATVPVGWGRRLRGALAEGRVLCRLWLRDSTPFRGAKGGWTPTPAQVTRDTRNRNQATFARGSSSPISQTRNDFGLRSDAGRNTLHCGSRRRWHKVATFGNFLRGSSSPISKARNVLAAGCETGWDSRRRRSARTPRSGASPVVDRPSDRATHGSTGPSQATGRSVVTHCQARGTRAHPPRTQFLYSYSAVFCKFR